MTAGKLAPIQSLRAIACWSVVVFHLFASLQTEFGWQHNLSFAAIGVDLFFVISGYIMAMIISREPTFSAPEFLLRRFSRIVPLYWLMTLAVVGVAVLLPHLMDRGPLNISELGFSLLFMPDPIRDTTIPTLSLGWTLNFEAFFYVTVAASVWLTRDRTLISTVAILAAAVVAGLLIDGGTLFDFYTQPIILEFAFGILIWNYGRLATAQPWFAAVWCMVMAVIGPALVMTGVTDDDWRVLGWGIPAALFFLGFNVLVTRSLPWLERLGDWSYSTYLLHIYVIQLFVKLAAAPAVAVPGLIWLEIVVVLALTALGSAILYRAFERPATQWLNRTFAERAGQ